MGYLLPTTTDWVTCSWQCHRDRSTPSSEPGTDYGAGYGQPVFAPMAGTVVDVKHDYGGGTGAYCAVDLDDGRRTRSLHMSEVWAWVGQRVSAGTQLGLSGASGYGDSWYYGPHVHQTLWNGHYYEFCSSCTIDFAPFVGPVSVEPTQRVVGANSANGRSDPSTANPATQTLDPNTVANMDGWVYGENVSGNNVWFHGAISGDWFWSGGFTDTGTHDLADMNVILLEPYQRQATSQVNGRAEPNTGSAVVSSLDTGAVGDFDGWINGESIEGEVRWLRGLHSGAYFSLKYLDPPNTDNLTDLNPVVIGDDRTNGENDTNVRGGPYTTFPVIGSIAPNAVVGMNGYAHGEDVQGIDIWFRREVDNQWAWSGGFTSQSVEGLEEVEAVPEPPNSNNPRGLPEYTPVNPACVIGLEAPLGYNDDGTPASRALCGGDAVDPVIDTFAVHHTGTTVDQLDYFSYKNDRSSCPTQYHRPDGSRIELIRPGYKPASTGPDWNCRTFAVEVLDETGAPNWLIPDLARRSVAEDIAWLAEFDGKTLDGVRVDFKIDADHVKGHNQMIPGTECPGPDMDIPGLIEMAWEVWYERHPEPECPECPDCPDPGGEVDVPNATLTDWQERAWSLYEDIDAYSEEADRGR